MENDKDKIDEFTARDEVAHMVFEKMLSKFIETYKIEDERGFTNASVEKWFKGEVDRMTLLSYYAADSMRKARLAAFK